MINNLFLDLDGVLADFDKKVLELTGKSPNEQPTSHMWRILSKHEHDFYNSLDFMPDAHELLNYTRKYNPIILTGLPMGNWAEPQKRKWCSRNLPGLQVITCFTRDKHTYCKPGDILIDDRIKTKDAWEKASGIFVHHISARISIAELKKLGY